MQAIVCPASRPAAALRPAVSPIHELYDHEPNSLAKCIQYLDHTDRVRAARTSRFMFASCCSAASWSCDDVLATLLESGNVAVHSKQLQQFRFNAPAVRCRYRDIPGIKSNPILQHARCVEVVLSATGSPTGLLEFERYRNAFPNLEHLALNDGGAHLPPPPSSQPETPSSNLKSITIMMAQFNSSPVALFLNSLPKSLQSIQLLFTPQAELKSINLGVTQFHLFQHLTNINILLRYPGTYQLEALVLGTVPRKSPVRIHCEATIDLTALARSSKQRKDKHDALPPSLYSAFWASLVYLHVPCEAELELIDWTVCCPSLRVLRFQQLVPANGPHTYARLNPNDDSQIRTLVIHYVPSLKQLSSVPSCVNLKTLTSLTVHSLCKDRSDDIQSMHKLDGTAFPFLTHLAFHDPFDWELRDFGLLPSLRTFEIARWASDGQQSRPDNLETQWREADDVITAASEASFNQANSQSGRYWSRSSSHHGTVFPSLIELNVRNDATHRNCFYARSCLRRFPNLRQIKWCDEPWLHPSQIDSYYSHAAIVDREFRRLQAIADREREIHADQYKRVDYRDFPSSEARVAASSVRQLSTFDLSLAFQSLTPVEVARASAVNKHWRNAALSKLVLSHDIRVEMHTLLGAKVHGPQIRISSLLPMTQCVSSAVFRNLRVLTLSVANPSADADEPQVQPLFRESTFGSVCVRLLSKVTAFASLHTLSLNWPLVNIAPNSETGESTPRILPTVPDFIRMQQVVQSSALAHLKTFRILAPPRLMYMIVHLLPKLRTLEVVELRYLNREFEDEEEELQKACRFAAPLLELPSLKYVYISQIQGETSFTQLEELNKLCSAAPPSCEEVMWRVPVSQAILEQIAERHRIDPSFTFKHLKSMYIPSLRESMNALSNASATMPDLCEISIGNVCEGQTLEPRVPHPLPPPLASRLRRFKLKLEIDVKTNTNKDRGARLALFMQSLVASNITQLECLHIFRSFAAADIPGDSSSTIHDSLMQFIDCNTNLTELNCPAFNLSPHRWERLAPGLRTVHSHRGILLMLPKCTHLQEFHAVTKPDQAVLKQLLELPFFQSAIYASGRGDYEIQSRVQIAQSLIPVDTAAIVSEMEDRRLAQILSFFALNADSGAHIPAYITPNTGEPTYTFGSHP